MLTITYANCLADRVGVHGIDPDRLAPGGEPAASIVALTRRLAQSRPTPPEQGGWERWRDLPFNPMRERHVSAVKRLVERYRERTDNLVVLGIGGSALGNIALHGALTPSTFNLLAREDRQGPRIFIVDNVDPAYFGSVVDFVRRCDPKLDRTVFNVISKSGETAETAAQFMCVRELCRNILGNAFSDHIVAITDENKGTMRKICEADGYPTLPVPDGVGGRFSVLSPVGLFSAAMCGIDVDALLDGAAAMDGACSKESLTENPAALLAFMLVELGTRKGKPNHVMMPYRNNLYSLADWYRQLWAESLGKKADLQGNTVYAGFTPIKALGTTDQHSQVQLYREGPNDKVFCFVDAEPDPALRDDLAIPKGLGVDALAYLEGKRMVDLLHAERRATEYAMVESQRPNFTITMPKLDAYHVGAFIYLWEMVTAYAGAMLNINTYDQPAVELGKQATFGLMGRPGYEKLREAVDRALGPTDRVVTA